MNDDNKKSRASRSNASNSSNTSNTSNRYNDACVNAVLPLYTGGLDTAALDGKDSTNYIVALVDIGLQGGYGVTSNDLYALAMNEVSFAFNLTYDPDDQTTWHSLLLDLGLLTERDTTVADLGGKDTNAFTLEMLRLFWDAYSYVPSSYNDDDYAACVDGMLACYDFDLDVIGGYLKFQETSAVVAGVEEVVIDTVEQTMIQLVEEVMIELAEPGVIEVIEELGDPYIRMALVLNGYTVLTASQYSAEYVYVKPISARTSTTTRYIYIYTGTTHP